MKGYVYTFLVCALAIQTARTYEAVQVINKEEYLALKNPPKFMTLGEHAKAIAADCKNYVNTKKSERMLIDKDGNQNVDKVTKEMEENIQKNLDNIPDVKTELDRNDNQGICKTIEKIEDKLTEVREANETRDVNKMHGCSTCDPCIFKDSNSIDYVLNDWHNYYQCVTDHERNLLCCKGCDSPNINPRMAKCNECEAVCSECETLFGDNKSIWPCPTEIQSHQDCKKSLSDLTKYFSDSDDIKKDPERCGDSILHGQINGTVAS